MTSPAKRNGPDLPAMLETIIRADAGDTRAPAVVRDAFQDTPAIAEHLSGLAYNTEDAILTGTAAASAASMVGISATKVDIICQYVPCLTLVSR
ncbi:MAG TPA: hypothetical protein VEW66_05125 [Thermomicrobiales bacterium]|nr:hypothetical protein [Thermomicrobiales bacterium]